MEILSNLGAQMQSTKGFFNEIAGWERWGGFEPEEMEFVRRVIKSVPIRLGDFILEPGCGAGRMSRMLAQAAGPAGWVLATDVSERMIGRARLNGVISRVSFAVAPAQALPVKSGSMDAAVCYNCFQHFCCAPRAIREMARALRPGGRLAIANSESLTDLCDTGHLPEAMQRNRMPALSELIRLLSAFGFEVVKLPQWGPCFLLVAEKMNGKEGGIQV